MEFYRNNEWKSLKINNEDTLIPKDWDLKSFKEIANKIGDGLHGTPKYAENSTYFFINGNNLRNGKIVIDENTKKISNSEYLKYKKSFNENTIFISINGTIGSLSFYDNEPVILGKSVGYVNLKNDENKNFIYYFLKSQQFEKSLGFDLTGSTIKNLSLASLRNTKIFYPFITEQEFIASLLSSQEKIMQKTKDLVTSMEKRNQFMMDELLSGRLRVKEQKGEPSFYKNPDNNWQSLKMNGENVEVPKDWDKYFLGSENIPFVKSGVKKYEGVVDYYATGEVNDFSLGEQPTGNFSYDKKPSRANVRVLDNTIYLARMKNTLKIIKFEKSEKFLLSTGFLGLQPNFKNVALDYLYYTVRSDNFQKIKNKECKGATQETLSDGAAEKIEILIPCIEEQILIANTLKSMFNELEKYNKILEKEEKTFTFLLEELMFGRLRIKI